MGERQKFFISTLGCKANQSESDAIAYGLEASGWRRVGDAESADVCIVNTCAVTGKAAMQSRQAARRAVRSGGRAKVVVTGCHAQTSPDELAGISGIGMIIGHGDKHRIPEMLKEKPEKRIAVRDIGRDRRFAEMPSASAGGRSRPFLKIQDGCDSFCTYCIVPYARGRSRSMPVEKALEGIRRFEKNGYREVVLTGIHLGCYGQDLSPPFSLEKLMGRIDESNTACRIRLSSVEPHELTEGIIRRTAGSEIFCRHFHIPLQSGDDGILEKMKRPYTNALFANLVSDIVKQIPEACVGADVLVGFPGETDAAFQNTFNLLETLPVSYLHVFPFSARKGTPAAKFPEVVHPETVKKRCNLLRGLGNRKKAAFYKKFLNKKLEILVESTRDQATGKLKGVSSNYIPVLVDGPDDLKNALVRAEIANVDEMNRVFGVL